ncbi:hypothetical protein [Actinomadura harenae]|uniref:Uncharacterized protein n=1 Tax=Actinomadura harenae TaxID=2483351 RepID=A0A3M2M8G9_9ACTN|nr:hypothetical protein [Actinomadura harenae]RMI45906.1 hypothetical protein EBO15_08290 [Actinomadura harenae]
MSQPSMRITVDAAVRARDVSRPVPEGAPQPPAPAPADPPRQSRAAKNERRRLEKRGLRPTA